MNPLSRSDGTSRPRAITTAVVLAAAIGIVVAGGWIAAGAIRGSVRSAAQVQIRTPVALPVVPSTTTTQNVTAPTGTNSGPPPMTSPTERASLPAMTAADLPGPPPSPTVSVYFVNGSDVSLNANSGRGCKAWMNGRTPGPYAQGLVQSWGDDCEMSLWRSTDGGQSFTLESGKHRLRSGRENTYFYWAGSGDVAKVCLTDYTIQKTLCDKPYGG